MYTWPYPLVIYSMNLKTTVGKCRGEGPGLERGRKGRQPKGAQTKLERPKDAEEMDRRET